MDISLKTHIEAEMDRSHSSNVGHGNSRIPSHGLNIAALPAQHRPHRSTISTRRKRDPGETEVRDRSLHDQSRTKLTPVKAMTTLVIETEQVKRGDARCNMIFAT
jgi:hypothetical protein